jgi:hypothetical protein
MSADIPRPIISLISEVFDSYYSHSQLDSIFLHANAPGNIPGGSKKAKIIEWLLRSNNGDGLKTLGKVLESFMEEVFPDSSGMFFSNSGRCEYAIKNRIIINNALGEHGLKYMQGGTVGRVGVASASLTLESMLKSKSIPAIDVEFKRALDGVENDPPASLTAACAIIESFCKVYLEENALDKPKDETIKPLWAAVAAHLGFDPRCLEDNDLKKILSGLSSIVDGIGALRTHAGSAHGRGVMRYNIQPRHARLAIHAAHTLVLFALESWKARAAD